MKIKYKIISDPAKIRKFALNHTGVILKSKVKNMGWKLKKLFLNEIKYNRKIMTKYRTQKLYRAKKELQIDLIKSGKKINPLIVMYENNWLVDGYARYAALEFFRIKKAMSYSGRYKDKKVKWDYRRKREILLSH